MSGKFARSSKKKLASTTSKKSAKRPRRISLGSAAWAGEFPVSEGTVNEAGRDAKAITALINTKERLIYHLIQMVEVDTEIKSATSERAVGFLNALGYPYRERRWKFMLGHGEPGVTK
jgi:hypothetical protein